MIETKKLLEKIQSIPQDYTLYLLETFPCGTGLFASNGKVLYLVPNKEGCTPLSIKTDYLCVETNIFVSAFNPSVSSFADGYYNYVELQLSALNDVEANLNAFVNLCLAHATYTHGEDFMQFFDSLVSLFQLPREQQYKNLVGLMGELLLIEYVYQNYNEDLSPFWHTDGTSSRLDFTCPFANLEIKTTPSDSLSFTIKHNQLFVDSKDNVLVAVGIEENNSGRTLEEVITRLLQDPQICNGMKFSVNIEKEKRRISPSEINARRFVLRKINFYRAVDINPFVNVPDCVENLSYKLNLLSFPKITFDDVLSSINIQSDNNIPDQQSPFKQLREVDAEGKEW
ncbi:MAG: PD-(D/E)XK motif protein [Bacteroidaceae bacterium]|nr:PD-(D/E)XK motif protein [Bacteroidaceae bacterium]